MKGAEAYVNDQLHSSGLTKLPEGPQEHCVTLRFIVPRADQTTALIDHISAATQQRLQQHYPGRTITAKPVAGSVVGDGTGDGISLEFHIESASSGWTERDHVHPS